MTDAAVHFVVVMFWIVAALGAFFWAARRDIRDMWRWWRDLRRVKP